MLFDTHAHVLSADRERYPYSALRGGAMIAVQPVVFQVEDLLQQMDANGVDRACLVQRATLYGYDNSYALDAAETCPERLTPVVVLDGQEPSAPAELRRLARERTLGGVRLVAPTMTRDNVDWLASDQALKFWAAAADCGLPITIIIYRHNNTAGRAALLKVARRFPGHPILVDHVGLPHASTPEKRWGEAQGYDYSIPTGPDFGVDEYLSDFIDMPHVHFKVTDINFDRLEEAGIDLGAFVSALAKRFGAERLVWGSDVGQSPKPYEKKVTRVNAAASALNEADRAAFSGGTAMRLYGATLKKSGT
jgi:L-fuconolactonase